VYQAAGIRQGPFRAEVPLPVPVDAERVEARYDRGLLSITLPKGGR
jgi:HSP20 family molecular chaperone IbpA